MDKHIEVDGKVAGQALKMPENAATALLKMMAFGKSEYQIPRVIPRCKRRVKR
jgi:hypothetical protein